MPLDINSLHWTRRPKQPCQIQLPDYRHGKLQSCSSYQSFATPCHFQNEHSPPTDLDSRDLVHQFAREINNVQKLPMKVFKHTKGLSGNITGCPCRECLEASEPDVTLTSDTDPIWHPPPKPPTASCPPPLSLECRWAIRFYLHAIAPVVRNNFKPTMARMCTTILEFGPTVIDCLDDDFGSMKYKLLGQIMRCRFAIKVLGHEWGTEQGEKKNFVDKRANHSLTGIDFIRDGFVSFGNETVWDWGSL